MEPQQIEPGVIDIPFQKLRETDPKTAKEVIVLYKKGMLKG